MKFIGFHQIWIVEHNGQYGNNTFKKWASLTYKPLILIKFLGQHFEDRKVVDVCGCHLRYNGIEIFRCMSISESV